MFANPVGTINAPVRIIGNAYWPHATIWPYMSCGPATFHTYGIVSHRDGARQHKLYSSMGRPRERALLGVRGPSCVIDGVPEDPIKGKVLIDGVPEHPIKGKDLEFTPPITSFALV